MKRKQFLLTTLAALPAMLFSQNSQKAAGSSKVFVVKNGGNRIGLSMKYKGVHPNDVIISRKDTANALSVFAYTGYDTIGPSMHMHLHQDEIFYVVEGKYRFVAGEEQMELGVGDTIFLPRNIQHSWIQLTKKGKLIYAVQPAGTLEDFFVELNDLQKPLTEEEAKAIHEKHGMKLMGPGLTL